MLTEDSPTASAPDAHTVGVITDETGANELSEESLTIIRQNREQW